MAGTGDRNRVTTKARLIGAVAELIAEGGIGGLGINAIARRAAADKVLIYRYFGGLTGLLSTYADEGDFWWQVDDMLAEPLPGPEDVDGLVRCLGVVFARHTAFLRSHPVTLEVIAWELAERNALTEALEQVREGRSQELMHRLALRFTLDKAAFVAAVGPMFALLGAAANYLAARGRRLRVYNGVDLHSEDGWRMIEQSATLMIAGVVAVQSILPSPPPRPRSVRPAKEA